MYFRAIAKKISLVAAVTTLSFGALSTQVAPAQAAVCGYYVTTERMETAAQVPVFGWSFDLFGGPVRVGHYGHCGNKNVKVRVDMKSSYTFLCVTPGDTSIGLTERNPYIKNVYYVGQC